MSALSRMVVKPKSIVMNPDETELRLMVHEMPNAQLTEFGNYNVQTRVTARSKASTYIVTDKPEDHTDQTITRAQGAAIARLQDEYIAQQDMLVIDGFIGPDPELRTPTRLIIERSNANIAAMQQQLYFTPQSSELESFEPALQVIYTPNLKAEGFPNDRVIAVDLDHGITRVLNSDYFGESKKGGLRMWNKLIYDRGGLPMHAGCKSIPVGDSTKVAIIIGLSGTGKTTTTFSSQNDSRPLQDDFIGLMPDGRIVATEDGCFAKTFGLSSEAEPAIYRAVTSKAAYLENVSQQADKLDFFDDSYTQNGRATFPLDKVPHGDVANIPRADFVLILNRNNNIIPAVAKLNREQAAAFFMLGETQGTSAGGVEEAGKALRVPGTNPFFPLRHGLQGTRFLELLNNLPMEVYLMNTGWVGGRDGEPQSRKVKIRHSSAIVKALAENTITWMADPDFGYQVAASVPGIDGDDEALLQPRTHYERTSRSDEYQTIVAALKRQRLAHLQSYPSLTKEILAAV